MTHCFFGPPLNSVPHSSTTSPLCSSGVNESRQVLQEQPDLAQSLLREPNTPVIRKSRGTSTQVGLQTSRDEVASKVFIKQQQKTLEGCQSVYLFVLLDQNLKPDCVNTSCIENLLEKVVPK